jgi:hypothetical protein
LQLQATLSARVWILCTIWLPIKNNHHPLATPRCQLQHTMLLHAVRQSQHRVHFLTCSRSLSSFASSALLACTGRCLVPSSLSPSPLRACGWRWPAGGTLPAALAPTLAGFCFPGYAPLKRLGGDSRPSPVSGCKPCVPLGSCPLGCPSPLGFSPARLIFAGQFPLVEIASLKFLVWRL